MNAGRRVGIEIFYFMDKWSDAQPPYFELARQAGYDGVEISLMADTLDDHTDTQQALDRLGLGVVCSTGLTPATDVSSPDAEIRRSGVEFLKRCLEVSADLGSDVLGGVTYTPWFSFPSDGDLAAYTERSVKSLREVAVAADAVGVDLCVELLNRFETHMLNTVQQANEFIDRIDHPSVKIELDTFHMNMEEADPAGAIRLAGDRLGHFQCAANDRGMPGTGHIDWDSIAVALDDIDYSGWLVVETFPNPKVETGRSTHAFRQLVPHLMTGATEAADFLRARLGGQARTEVAV